MERNCLEIKKTEKRGTGNRKPATSNRLPVIGYWLLRRLKPAATNSLPPAFNRQSSILRLRSGQVVNRQSPSPFAPCALIRDERGFVLIVAMAILLLVTFLGIISITTTSMDVDISRNIRTAGRSFYITDGCISLARTVLEEATDYNTVLAGHGNAGDLAPAQSDWPYPFTNTGEEKPGVILYDLAGAPIRDYAFSGGTVTAYVRNNEDDPSLLWNTDTDTIVVVTCEGRFGISSQSEIVAAVARIILGAEFYGDYPQKNLGPQNLNLVEFEIQF